MTMKLHKTKNLKSSSKLELTSKEVTFDTYMNINRYFLTKHILQKVIDCNVIFQLLLVTVH